MKSIIYTHNHDAADEAAVSLRILMPRHRFIHSHFSHDMISLAISTLECRPLLVGRPQYLESSGFMLLAFGSGSH